MQTRLGLSIALSLVACSKKDPAPQGKQATAPTTADAPVDFDLAGVAKKFDGKTFVIATSLGKQVWSFAGGKVTIVEGQTESVGDLEVRSPCSLAVRAKRADGLEDVKEKSFAWNGDTLYMGTGYGGAKRGDTYFACYGLDVYVMKGGSCKLGKASAKCTVDGNKLVTDNVSYEIVGDALVDSRLKASVAEQAPTLADAKAKLAAL